MAVLAVARIGAVPPLQPDDPRRHPKMAIVAEGGVAFEVPYAPNDVSLDGVAPTFVQVDRAGRRPLLIKSASGLEVLTFDLVFGHPDPQESIAGELAALRDLAASGDRCRIRLDDTSAAHKWRLTGFTQQVIARQYGTNAPTRALCNLTFTEVSDPLISITRRGGDGGGKGNSGKGGKKNDDDKRPKFYTVKKGDTLPSIAKEFYGNPSVWPKIADANKIRHPKKDLKVGTKLKLPMIDQYAWGS
jgi:hypothetical protein